MGSKFYFGDRVFLKDIGVGRVTNIAAHTNNMTGNIDYRYEVTFDSDHLVDWFDENELELYVEKSCEPSNNIIQNSATRPCYYMDTKATFHRWVDETKMIVKYHSFMKIKEMAKLKKMWEDFGIVPAEAVIVPTEPDMTPLTTTLALIELKDGSMKKVPPEEIRFITDEELFYKER